MPSRAPPCHAALCTVMLARCHHGATRRLGGRRFSAMPGKCRWGPPRPSADLLRISTAAGARVGVGEGRWGWGAGGRRMRLRWSRVWAVWCHIAPGLVLVLAPCGRPPARFCAVVRRPGAPAQGYGKNARPTVPAKEPAWGASVFSNPVAVEAESQSALRGRGGRGREKPRSGSPSLARPPPPPPARVVTGPRATFRINFTTRGERLRWAGAGRAGRPRWAGTSWAGGRPVRPARRSPVTSCASHLRVDVARSPPPRVRAIPTKSISALVAWEYFRA
jgi:hypothetical protein